jgi:hypothetical protein
VGIADRKVIKTANLDIQAFIYYIKGVKSMNKAAQALGRLGKGKPKTYSRAERKRRALRLAEVRKKRWIKKP